MTSQTAKPKTKSLQGIEDCRVVEIGVGNLAECAQWGPVTCSYAMPFGYCLVCMHPRVDEIIENTKKVLVAAKIQVVS
ncbi:MAG TPA: hypothetical protein VK897_13500 [Anaerolineales bacterium]|nr:hypothetical protein [Anaerolineales bacterium]